MFRMGALLLAAVSAAPAAEPPRFEPYAETLARMSEANFQSMLAEYQRGDPAKIMEYEMTHHMEE